MPRITRYTTKGVKVRERTSLRVPHTATHPVTAELAMPQRNGGQKSDGIEASASENTPAPAMIGRLIRKTSRAAASRSKPRNRLTVRVAPLRLTPGCSASAWPTPIASASRSRNSVSARRSGRRSATSSNSPNTINMTAIIQMRSRSAI